MLHPFAFRKGLARAAVICCGIAAGTLAVWACGGGSAYPAWLLGRPWLVLDAPAAVLPVEIDRLRVAASVKARPADKDDPFRQTADTDISDLKKMLEESGVAEESRERLLERYATVRRAWSGYAAARHVFHESESLHPRLGPIGSDLRLPDGLPGEVADYMEGAIAYHQERFLDARAAWEHLLARPVKERQLRSTWAAFMLGKLALRTGGPDDAVDRFEQTRKLVAQGFADGLGLGASSLGWEARAELLRGHPETALALYARQYRSGEHGALTSIELICRKVLEGGTIALKPIAHNADARKVLTAYLISRSQPSREETDGSSVLSEDLEAWFQAVKEADPKEVEEADRLAWAFYQAGDFNAARAWLEKAPADEPMARWIRAKLLLRDGKLAEAEALLSQVSREITPAANLYGERLAIAPQASAEAAVVRTDLGRYPEALDTFLRSGFWIDAAYIAEQVLTLDELTGYVDAHWPASAVKNGEADPYVSRYNPKPEAVAVRLRALLGRRLVRLGRYREARKYLPHAARPWLDALSASLRQGGNAKRPPAQRADDLFRAACIFRQQGLELLGTEIGPDWNSYEAMGDLSSVYPVSFADRTGDGLRPAAEEEERRLRGTAEVTPQKRFHYRYTAAGLAGKAAGLLPATSDRKATILATAGTWLMYKDPQAADPFYKALATTHTGLGRQAAAMRWIPKTAECEDDLLGPYRFPSSAPK